MSYIDRINVQGTEYDVLDRRVRLADGQDFDYGTLVQGGINNTNGYTTGTVLRRSETYWPVIEGPANIVMSNGLTGYIRLYDADKTMIDPGEGMPGSDTTNHVLVIAQNSTLTLTMKEYNPNTAYFRFYFSCGTKDNISALVRENARIVPLQTVATSGEMQMLGDDVSDLKSAFYSVVQISNVLEDNANIQIISGAGASVTSITGVLKSYNLADYGLEAGDVIKIAVSGYSTNYPDTITDVKLGLYFYDTNGSLIGSRNRVTTPGTESLTIPENTDYFNVLFVATCPNGNTKDYTFGLTGVTMYVGDYKYQLSPEVKVSKESIINSEFPDYYNDYLDAKIQTIQQKNLLSGRRGDSFIFLTDPHWMGNSRYSTALAKAISQKTNNKMYICGGDILSQGHTRAEALSLMWAYMNDIRDSFGDKYRYIVGNHELNTMSTVSDADHLNWDDVYAICMKEIETSVKIFGSSDIENFIYYWDNPAQNIRYIVLNGGTAIQYSGNYRPLDSILRSAPAGYKIGVFGHGFFKTDGTLSTSGEYIAGMLDAVNGRTSYTFYGTTFDYSDIDLEIMFILGGHTHKDLYVKTSNGVPIIGVTTDNYSLENGELTRSIGTTSEQAFEAVDIDIDNRTIYLTRIGAGNDRFFTWNVSA